MPLAITQYVFAVITQYVFVLRSLNMSLLCVTSICLCFVSLCQPFVMSLCVYLLNSAKRRLAICLCVYTANSKRLVICLPLESPRHSLTFQSQLVYIRTR